MTTWINERSAKKTNKQTNKQTEGKEEGRIAQLSSVLQSIDVELHAGKCWRQVKRAGQMGVKVLTGGYIPPLWGLRTTGLPGPPFSMNINDSCIYYLSISSRRLSKPNWPKPKFFDVSNHLFTNRTIENNSEIIRQSSKFR